ncbi:MAG: hypothetical protein AAF740_00160 [Bacteroidota bacterium]
MMKVTLKNVLFIALMFSVTFSVSAQEEGDYMDEVARGACDCMKEIPKDENAERYQMRLGLCFLEPATKYAEEIKRDYGLDLTRMDAFGEDEGEQLGQVIGLKMLNICPEVLMDIAESGQFDEEEEDNAPASGSFEGSISGVEIGTIVVFTAKDSRGKSEKFYWMGFVESNVEDLANTYEKLKKKKVQIEYVEREVFDPRIGEYRNVKVITGLLTN